MKFKDLDFMKFKPYVRYAYICTRSSALKIYFQPLYAYDHRMFYVTEGKVRIVTEGCGSFDMEQGDCLVLAPGIGYRVLVGEKNVHFAIISFDFDDVSYGEKSRRPDKKEDYQSKAAFSEYTPEAVGKVTLYTGCFELMSFVYEMCKQMSEDYEGKFDCASALMKCIIIKLCNKKENADISQTGDVLAERIKGYVDREFAENISNVSIASHFGYHPYYVGDVFRKATGVTLHDYITHKRRMKAKNLLADTLLSVSETAQLCGFSNPCYFSECFKKYTGISPLEYRKRNI